LFDLGSYVHALRLLHYFAYSHVKERRRMRVGRATGIAPNVSLRNGERITLGARCHIGERCYLWAGPSTGRITIGDQTSLAPGVFITASDYRFEPGIPFREQPKRERDVVIGSDVWLGTAVVVTAGVTIGDGCIVGAGAVVTRDLPAGCIAVGVPARPVSRRGEAPAPEAVPFSTWPVQGRVDSAAPGQGTTASPFSPQKSAS
jgi:acetyltransferase-like isoleucine patch superfamily enzyme